MFWIFLQDLWPFGKEERLSNLKFQLCWSIGDEAVSLTTKVAPHKSDINQFEQTNMARAVAFNIVSTAHIIQKGLVVA